MSVLNAVVSASLMIAEFAAVDVDRHDRFRRIDHQRSAAGQRHVPAVHQLDFALDAELVEHRHRVFVQLDFVLRARIGELDDLLDPLAPPPCCR